MISPRRHVQVLATARHAKTTALDRLVAAVKARSKERKPSADFAEFERELHEQVMGVERELIAAELARADVDADVVEIDGASYRKAVRSIGHYQTAAGVVHVERTLYRNRSGGSGGRCVAALDLQVGVVEERWTPLAAKQASWIVAHMTPAQGEELLHRLGNMTPSKSSLERLPKGISEHWEAERPAFDEALRAGEHVPEDATIVHVHGADHPVGRRGHDGEAAAGDDRATPDGRAPPGASR